MSQVAGFLLAVSSIRLVYNRVVHRLFYLLSQT